MGPNEVIPWTVTAFFMIYSVLQWLLQGSAERDWLRRLRTLEQRVAKLEPLPDPDLDALLKQR